MTQTNIENISTWLALETGSYGTDPSSNGSGYTWTPDEAKEPVKDESKPIPTAYGTGRPWRTPSLPGPKKYTMRLKVPMIGLLVSPAASEAPSATLTYLQIILLHILGGARTINGIAIANPAADSFELASNALDPQDIVPIWESGKPTDAERTQWAHVVAETVGPPRAYDIEPEFETTVTTAAVLRGVRIFSFNGLGGDTLAAYRQEDDEYFTYLGGRITSASISDEPEMRAMLEVTIEFNRRVEGTKASIPDPASGPAIHEIVGVNSPVTFNNVEIDCAKTTFDFGIAQADPDMSRVGVQGRSGHKVRRLNPKLTIDPMGGASYETLMEDQTIGEASIQYGAGVLADGTLNTIFIKLSKAQVSEASRVNDSGRRRMSTVIELSDEVMFASGVASKALQIGVA